MCVRVHVGVHMCMFECAQVSIGVQERVHKCAIVNACGQCAHGVCVNVRVVDAHMCLCASACMGWCELREWVCVQVGVCLGQGLKESKKMIEYQVRKDDSKRSPADERKDARDVRSSFPARFLFFDYTNNPRSFFRITLTI